MKPLLFIVSLVLAVVCTAQSKKDTTYILYDASWNVISSGKASYVGVVWKEGTKWHKQDYYYPDSKLKMDGVYADKNFKIRDGIFTSYTRAGMMSDSCLYTNNKKEGTEINWNKNGNQIALLHWHQHLPVDTAIWWNTDGKLTAIQITDSLGNGRYQAFLDDGKTIRVDGRLAAGKRSGKWTFKDSKGIVGAEAMYNADSVITATCFDEKGEPDTTNECIIERPAAFKGGANGWRRYLEKKLIYPEYALKNKIQGVVTLQFVVQKDGTVTDVTVLNAPDESLGKEGVRILEGSPKWQPAVQYNRVVIYRHIQSITFGLE